MIHGKILVCTATCTVFIIICFMLQNDKTCMNKLQKWEKENMISLLFTQSCEHSFTSKETILVTFIEERGLWSFSCVLRNYLYLIEFIGVMKWVQKIFCECYIWPNNSIDMKWISFEFVRISLAAKPLIIYFNCLSVTQYFQGTGVE